LLGEWRNQLFRMAANLDSSKTRRLPLSPRLEAGPCCDIEINEGRMAGNRRLDVRDRRLQLDVARPIAVLEEHLPEFGERFPVVSKRINVTLRDPSVEVGVDVLHVFRLARVDVAREVQVEVVRCALDLRKRSEPGIALDLRSLS